MTLYHLERVGNESEMKLFDIGVLAFCKIKGRYKKGFMATIAWVNEALTNKTRRVKRYTCIPGFMYDGEGFNLQRNKAMRKASSQKTDRNDVYKVLSLTIFLYKISEKIYVRLKKYDFMN